MTDALTDAEAISAMRAVAHPVRLRILSLLTAQAMSAAEVARELDLTHANASYHLRVLHDAEELVVESEEKIRGGMAKRYRYVILDKPSGPITTEDLIAYAHAISTEVTRRMQTRKKAPSHWADIETWVEPAVWDEALALANRASQLLHDGALPPQSDGAVHVSYSGMAFRMEDTTS